MTAEILVPGHIKCVQRLYEAADEVIISLLTDEALKGYKNCRVPFEDRRFILETCFEFWGIPVVPQKSLDPTANIKKYKITHLATGDTFEKEELKAIKQCKIKQLKVQSGHPTHSSDIKQS